MLNEKSLQTVEKGAKQEGIVAKQHVLKGNVTGYQIIQHGHCNLNNMMPNEKPSTMNSSRNAKN